MNIYLKLSSILDYFSNKLKRKGLAKLTIKYSEYEKIMNAHSLNYNYSEFQKRNDNENNLLNIDNEETILR